MNKRPLVFIGILILMYACNKHETTPSYPEFKVYCGTDGKYGDTTYQSLAAVGHLSVTEMTKQPAHAVYNEMGKDSFGLVYYYSPQKDFHGTDTVMFKSSEPSLKSLVVSTFYFKVH